MAGLAVQNSAAPAVGLAALVAVIRGFMRRSACSLARKQIVPASRGMLRPDSPTFAALLLGVIVITSGLSLLPALMLGPVVEGLQP
jgi:K+-transporting ATPase ATPase A chain